MALLSTADVKKLLFFCFGEYFLFTAERKERKTEVLCQRLSQFSGA